MRNGSSYWVKRNGYNDLSKLLGAPVTMSSQDNQYYRDCVEEKYLLITHQKKNDVGKEKGKKRKKN